MNDRELDRFLKRAADASREPGAAQLDRITQSIAKTLSPVRPLPPAPLLAGSLMLICAGIASLGAAHLGLAGIHALSPLDRSIIFPALVLFTALAAMVFTSEMIPGSRRRISAAGALAFASAGIVAVFAILFRDYSTDDFLHQGLICLNAGVLHAIPASLLCWLVLRRGFAVNPVAAGLSAGLLGGFAGLGMLELHCANFEAPHVMLWHTGVLLVNGALGSLVAWIWTRRRA